MAPEPEPEPEPGSSDAIRSSAVDDGKITLDTNRSIWVRHLWSALLMHDFAIQSRQLLGSDYITHLDIAAIAHPTVVHNRAVRWEGSPNR